jgi:molybdenum cofactor guanylyltransferase
VPALTSYGVILAGGAASRLGGGDKPLLPLGNGTVLDEILRRLRPQVDAVAISVRTATDRFAAFGLPMIPDAEGAGPMAGVAAALHWAETAGASSLLVVPGDTPFLPPDLAARLAPPPAVAEAGGRVHNLVCLLPVMIRPVLVAWLAQGHTRAGEFLSAIAARRVVFDDPSAFLNINTPDDLDAARRSPASEMRPASL